jgi:hypothetical protein
MRARSALVALLLALGGSAHAGAPAHLDYDAGVRGWFQRNFGKKVVHDGASTHTYRRTPNGFQLMQTETVTTKNGREVTTRMTFLAPEQRMTLAEAKLVLGGERDKIGFTGFDHGYLYRVSKAGERALQLHAEMIETLYRGAQIGIGTLIERRYQLKDGVIESWTNGSGTTFRTP